MRGDAARLIGLGIGAVVVIGTGIALTLAGKPYSGLLLNVHKLVDLGLVVTIGWLAWQAHKAGALAGGVWALLLGTAIMVVVAFASGGVASGMQVPPTAVLWAHRVGSVLAAIGMAASTWMLLGR